MGKWKVNREKINNDIPGIDGNIEGFGISYSTKRMVIQNKIYDDVSKQTETRVSREKEKSTVPLPESEVPEGKPKKEPIGNPYKGIELPDEIQYSITGVESIQPNKVSKFKVKEKEITKKYQEEQQYQTYYYYQDYENVTTNTYEVTCYGNNSSDKFKQMFTNQIIPSTTINITKTVVDCGDEPTPPEPPTNYIISDDNYPTLNSVCKSFGWSSDGIGVTQDDANLITAIPDNDNYYVSKFANCSEEEINYLLQVCPNLTKIGNYAFTSMPFLTSINLRNVNTLGYGSFYNCASLASIDLSNIEDVPYYCFSNCSKLTDVTLSDSDNLTIGSYAFYLCTGLESIDLKKTKVISDSMLRQCTSLKNIIGNEVTVIDDYAFYYSSVLQEVNFPKCEKIGSQAFCYTYLTTFNSNSLITLGHETFNHTNLENIDTRLLTNGGQRGFDSCQNLKTIDFSNIVEGENVLYGSIVQDVILPDYSYTTIWQNNDCTPFGMVNNIVNAHCKASDLTNWQAYFNGGGGQIIPVENWITE